MDAKSKQKLEDLLDELVFMCIESKFSENEQEIVLGAIDDLHDLIEE